MNAISMQDTIVLNKKLSIPSKGLICAHPGRVERIAKDFLKDSYLHTDYRGYQIYIGTFREEQFFVANTGIGAPAAAFLLEELIAFGAKKIIRLGSNDSNYTDLALTLVEETSLPRGLLHDYEMEKLKTVKINGYLEFMISLKASKLGLKLTRSNNKHIDGYYVAHRERQGSSDMETGALYFLGHFHQIHYASLLLSYPKHGSQGEYGGLSEAYELEANGISLALEALSD